MAHRVNCPCGAEYDLAEPSLGASFVCTDCGAVYAVVEAESVPQPDALPLANCRCGAPIDLNGVAVGECLQCACARGIWAVRATRADGAPAPRDGMPEPWTNALWALWATRETLLVSTLCQGVASVLVFTSVSALVLLLQGIQLLLWLALVGCQAAALGTPDRGARRAVLGSLVFSVGGIVVGTAVALSVALVYGVLAGMALTLIGSLYWITYFNRLGIALRAHELSDRAVRYTSATVLVLLLWVVALTTLGDNTPPPRDPQSVEPKKSNAPNRFANARIPVVHLALSVWLLVGYTKLSGTAEQAIRERTRRHTSEVIGQEMRYRRCRYFKSREAL